MVGGPNRSGQSSAYREARIEAFGRSFWIINPDLLAARIRDVEGLDLTAANIAAVQRIEAWLEASIKAHQTVGVETVLSTEKYRRLVDLALGLGFEFRFIYVVLDDPRRNLKRVRIRVTKGGHAVPEDKILEGCEKSFAQMPWFLDRAHAAWLVDNSGATLRLVGEKAAGVITLDPSAPAALVSAVRRISTGQGTPIGI